MPIFFNLNKLKYTLKLIIYFNEKVINNNNKNKKYKFNIFNIFNIFNVFKVFNDLIRNKLNDEINKLLFKVFKKI